VAHFAHYKSLKNRQKNTFFALFSQYFAVSLRHQKSNYSSVIKPMEEIDYARLQAEFEADAFKRVIVDGEEMISMSSFRAIHWNDGSGKVTIMFENGNTYVKEGVRIILKGNWKEYMELKKKGWEEQKFNQKDFARYKEWHDKHAMPLPPEWVFHQFVPFVPCNVTEPSPHIRP
jgi:hypothetical protein